MWRHSVSINGFDSNTVVSHVYLKNPRRRTISVAFVLCVDPRGRRVESRAYEVFSKASSRRTKGHQACALAARTY